MRLTPRKFQSQLSVHKYFQQLKYGAANKSNTNVMQASAGYIDQIPGW